MHFTVNADLDTYNFEELAAFVDSVRSIPGAVVAGMTIDEGTISLEVRIDPAAERPATAGASESAGTYPVGDLLRMKRFLEDLSSFGPADRYRGRIADALEQLDSYLTGRPGTGARSTGETAGRDGGGDCDCGGCQGDNDREQKPEFFVFDGKQHRADPGCGSTVDPEETLGDRVGQMGHSVANAIGDALDSLFGSAGQNSGNPFQTDRGPGDFPAGPRQDTRREPSHSYGDFGGARTGDTPATGDADDDDARRIRQLRDEEKRRRQSGRDDSDGAGPGDGDSRNNG